MQFLHQMFVSALLLDDALLKCVVLLQMFSWFWQWNKFENRL